MIFQLEPKKYSNILLQIMELFWRSGIWSQSFCLITTGGAPIEVKRKYIESQGEK